MMTVQQHYHNPQKSMPSTGQINQSTVHSSAEGHSPHGHALVVLLVARHRMAVVDPGARGQPDNTQTKNGRSGPTPSHVVSTNEVQHTNKTVGQPRSAPVTTVLGML
jgi:hypothetical protein